MDQPIVPPLLKSSDTIGIVAPGRKLSSDVLKQAISILKTWGAHVICGDHILSDKHSYLSGTDEERLADFQSMINDPNVRAIICARGGYGSTRFVDELDFSALHENPKWLVGFSDVTALHLRFLKEGVASIHGTMPVLFPKVESASSIESLRKLLFEGECSIDAMPAIENRTGIVEAIVVGGNLSLLADSLGTKTEIDTDNKILILEEVDEYSYRLDRMMNQMQRAGKFQNLRGLVIGHMTDIKEGDLIFGESIIDIVNRNTAGSAYPVAYRFPSGHENPNFAWVSGGQGRLDVQDSGVRLTFQSLKLNS
jgi:muramoyltetrapeptide carboxypeptidase